MANAPRKAVKRGPPKDRVLFMAYKGELTSEPEFAFDKDNLIDRMLEDRELKVKKITIPRSGRPRKDVPAQTA